MSDRRMQEKHQAQPQGNTANDTIKECSSDMDIRETPSTQSEQAPQTPTKKRERPLKYFGWFCMAIFAMTIASISGNTVDTSEAAQQAFERGYSTELAIGVRLLSDDEPTAVRDIDIVHSHIYDNTDIWIWDFAAEDGDYVQILVNGVPLGDAFMIRHRPVQLNVPAVGSIQVLGIRDGGGGITYALHFGLNGTTYFNTAPVGGYNTFTLMR